MRFSMDSTVWIQQSLRAQLAKSMPAFKQAFIASLLCSLALRTLLVQFLRQMEVTVPIAPALHTSKRATVDRSRHNTPRSPQHEPEYVMARELQAVCLSSCLAAHVGRAPIPQQSAVLRPCGPVLSMKAEIHGTEQCHVVHF